MKTKLTYGLLASLPLVPAAASAQDQKPNILFIQADQLSVKALSCYGGAVETPNLDRLAREGALFEHAYASRPTSSPCRASIVTGLYTHQHGVVSNTSPKVQQGLGPGDVTTDKILWENGYATHHYGKWHIGGEGSFPYFPDMYGYTNYMQTRRGEAKKRRAEEGGEDWMYFKGMDFPVELADPIRKKQNQFREKWGKKESFESFSRIGRLKLDTDQWVDYQVATRAIETMTSYKDSGRPFMVTASFIWPHDPNFAPSEYYDRIDPDKLQLPGTPVIEDIYKDDWSAQLAKGWGKDGVKEFLRIYYANVMMVDDQVGRLLDALEKNGQLDNTLVVFVADHGDMMGNHSMVWKTTKSFYQDVAQVPLLIRYPKAVKAGKRYSMPVSVVDLMPTFLSAAGMENLLPEDRPGINLLPYLKGRKNEKNFPRTYVFSERIDNNSNGERRVSLNPKAGFMATDTHWKYVIHPDGRELLFNMDKDPLETEDVASLAENRSRVLAFRAELRKWLEETQWTGGYSFLDKLN